MEHREDQQHRQSIAAEQQLLATDLVRQPAEANVKGGSEQSADRHVEQGICLADPCRALQEIEGAELAGVIDDGQASGDAEQRDENAAEIAGLFQAVDDRVLRRRARFLHRLEHRAFGELHTDEDRDGEHDRAGEERDAPAPVSESVGRHRCAANQHGDHREEKATNHRDLNPAGVLPALAGRGVLSDVDRRAAIFAAERQALEQPQQHKQRRRGDAGGGIGRQHADECGCRTHQRDGDEEGIFAADLVAEIAEQDRAERTHTKARTKCGKAGEGRSGRIVRWKKQRSEQRSKDAVDEEIIPFEHRPQC